MKKSKTLLSSLLTLSVVLPCFADPAEKLPNYQSTTLPTAEITSVGSDSMGGIMNAWIEKYQKLQPNVVVRMSAGGSASAVPALSEGEADIGPMARDIKPSEREEFRGRFGFDPTQIRTAVAPIAIYVSEKNPLSKLSLTELDAIFSIDRKRGGAREVLWWADLGVAGPWATAKIVPMGLGENSLLQTYFKQQAMLQGEFRSNVQTTANANAIFRAIEVDQNVIGYGELSSPPPSVKILAISNLPGEPALLPTGGNIVSESYPLTRYLNVYMARAPFTDLDPAAKDFLQFVLSREGQTIVQEQGLMPLPPSIAAVERQRLQ